MVIKREDEDKLSREAGEAIDSWKASRPDLAQRKLEKAKSKTIYINFPDELKVALQLLATKKSMGYQTYLKMIISDHIEEAKKEGKIDDNAIKKAMGS